MARVENFDFSFSGLKTAVLRLIQKHKSGISTEDLAASFQDVMVTALLNKTFEASRKYNIDTVALAGGVAANSALRKAFSKKFCQYNTFIPELKYCTDNAAMVASAAYFVDGCYNLDVEVFSRG